MSKRILIVEDDEALARVLRDNLVYEGFAVDWASDGSVALSKVRHSAPDLVLLDVMLPDLDGFEICRSLSQGPTRTPIIVLTARTQKEDKVRGLELGADDYVTKPFALDELLARIHAILRRSHPSVERLVLGSIVLDFRAGRALRNQIDLRLSHRELELMRYLAEHQGRVVTREELLRAVWGYRNAPCTRAVDNFVARLRRKIEPDPHQPRFIRTVHGDGYCLTPNL